MTPAEQRAGARAVLLILGTFALVRGAFVHHDALLAAFGALLAYVAWKGPSWLTPPAEDAGQESPDGE